MSDVPSSRRPVVGDPAEKDALAQRIDEKSVDSEAARIGDADTPGLEAKRELADADGEHEAKKVVADADVAAPSEDDARIMEHAYDGILEYDNPMPRWWVWMFWGSFWFSCAYVFHYWIGNGSSVKESYEVELAAAQERAAAEAMKVEVSEESLHSVMGDSTSLEAGKEIYLSNCQACHLERGQGSIGPNLTDDYWVHGTGTLMGIYETVSNGVPEKGMPAWQKQLTPQMLRQVVAYVGTLRGTNVDGKPPEGEPISNTE